MTLVELVLLIKIIVKSFYSFEHFLFFELLLYHQKLSCDQISNLLCFDKKFVINLIQNFKDEQILTIEDNYYFINFDMFLNLIKRKISCIRLHIESIQSISISESKEIKLECILCSKIYTDLDTKYIFDSMKCSFCNGDLRELLTDFNTNLLSKFNNQFEKIFQLLKIIDNFEVNNFFQMKKSSQQTIIKDFEENIFTDTINKITSKNFEEKVFKILLVHEQPYSKLICFTSFLD